MASETSKSQTAESTDPAASGAPDALAVNLQIVSPSVGVNRPLLFPDLPAVTTIRQLKDKIRHALPLRPADENQRLIHRGRALLRESDSLLEIFGANTLQTPDRQTIHLVIRDPIDSHSSSPAPTTGRDPSPLTGSQNSTSTMQASSQMQSTPQPTPTFTRRTHSQPAAAAGSRARIPSPAPSQAALPTDPTATFQQQHQNMTNWMGQIQREAMARAIVHQNQRGRAHIGMRGIGDSGGGHGQMPGNQTDHNGGRASPAPSQTIYREVVGPNGLSYQVQMETVIRSAAPGQQNGLSPIDVQNILRGADANQLTNIMTSAMQRSASGASVHGRPLHQPGVTTTLLGSGVQMAGSGRATPDSSMRYPSGMGGIFAPVGTSSNSPRQGVEVYILSSPEGPRALLINNATSETYYTPRLRPQTSMPRLRTAASFPNLARATALTQSQQIIQPQQQQQPQQGNNVGPANNQPPRPARDRQAGAHPANPPAAGIPPLLLRAWPHIWLILRLAVFIWLFTNPTSSWSRWFTVICLAVLVFLLSTGVLNGVAENAWRPFGRHLEHFLPTPEQHVRRQQRPPAGPGVAQEHQPLTDTAEIDAAQMAARLVAEHEGQSWLSVQFRRLERAGLLFLASIAPGVAERHIANLEAEAQAEETRRREAAEAAAAASTESTGAAEGSGDQHNDDEVQAPLPQDGQRREEPQGNLGRDGVVNDLIAL